ncbi:MAG: hypothetical protein Q8Q32_01050 [bacterium]|nr:hypothetical protein [bacterium]
MNEGLSNNFEGKQEHIPSLEEVRAIFEQFLKGKEYEEIRRKEDEQGLYLWDIRIPDEEGNIEYSYMRKGRYTEGQASTTAIHVIFFDKEGLPVGGHSVAKYVNNEWGFTP